VLKAKATVAIRALEGSKDVVVPVQNCSAQFKSCTINFLYIPNSGLITSL